MVARGSRPTPNERSASGSERVEQFLAALDHPRKAEILALRAIILGADPSIAEEIKWNAPSFHTTEHFATFQLRARNGLQIILHRGAKPRADGAAMQLADPAALLTWLGQDRASATFRDLPDVAARGAAFADLIRAWIAFV